MKCYYTRVTDGQTDRITTPKTALASGAGGAGVDGNLTPSTPATPASYIKRTVYVVAGVYYGCPL